MAKLAIVFGVLLIVLGVAGFVMTGSVHPTALIPAWFGLGLVICGGLASTEDARRRMLWMHIAVTIGLIGFVFPGAMAIREGIVAHGVPAAHTAAVAFKHQVVMSILCLIFVALCVRSFIAARRARV
ncbi:MAG TPA: hypothetical protein VHY48_14340 [Acidobacteriaceae bacterium]|jgi:hypothetical protein|nr:hypothetical protein [Acidobacteriaceae bacterium]